VESNQNVESTPNGIVTLVLYLASLKDIARFLLKTAKHHIIILPVTAL